MGKKMAVRMSVLVIIIYAALVIPVIVAANQAGSSRMQKNLMISVYVYAGLRIDALEQKMNVNDINTALLLDTEQADILEETLLPYSIEADGINSSFTIAMVYDNGTEEPYILWPASTDSHSPLAGQYPAKLSESIRTARERQAAQTVVTGTQDKKYLIIPAKREENNLFYLVGAVITDQNVHNMGIWNDRRRNLLIYGMVIVLFLLVVIYLSLRPIRRLSKAMAQVSAGNYDLPKTRFPNNELGDMWITMHQMCQALRTQEHMRGNVLDYYYRFAPKKFEQLFQKKLLQDVKIGDTVTITATVGIVSVAPEAAYLRGAMREKQIRGINRLLDIINEENNKKGGILLSNDSNQESIKVIYREQPNSIETAVQFGIDSIQALEAKKEDDNAVYPFVMLYTGQFTCGLAGTSEQVYPFVTSVSLELLSTYIESFKNIGVKMILIGRSAVDVQVNHITRAIGYLSSENGQEVYQVCEVLDAGGRKERQGKLASQGQFQQALQLFYDNDFYLARNCFKEVLKECPEDGVAKWYLFLCEDMLNAASSEDIRYDLFPYGVNNRK